MSLLDVRDYGAAGDGRTDDTEAIQSAIDDAEENDTVHIPSGTYLISQDDASNQPVITIDGARHADGLTVEGDGANSIILLDDIDTSYNMIRVTNPDDYTLTLRNFVLDGDRDSNDFEKSAATGLAFRDTGATGTGDMRVENVEIRNQGNVGLSIGYGGVIVRHCTSHHNYRHGFTFNTHRSGRHRPASRYEFCHAYQNGQDQQIGDTGRGIDASGGVGIVEDTVIEENQGSGGTKTSKDAIDFTFRRVRVRNCNSPEIYQTTSTPESATVMFEDFVGEENDGFMRISSGTHTVPSGGQLLLTNNGPSEVSDSGQLFLTRGVTFQVDGELYSNRAVEGEGLNAWDTDSSSYIENYYHYQNDAGSVKNDNIAIANRDTSDRGDITGVPTAEEVGAWSDGNQERDEDNENEGESENEFESWTPQWESRHGNYSIVETDSSNGDALLALDPDSGGRHFLSWDRVGEATDVEIVVLTRVVSNDDIFTSWCRPIVRAGGDAGSEEGYFTDVKPDTIRIRKYTGGELTTLAESNTDRNVDRWFYLRFRVEGDQLKVRQWDLGDVEPTTWDVETVDEEISSSGLVGIGGVSTDTQYWDFVSVATDGATAPLDGSDSALGVEWETPTDGESVAETVPIRIAANGADAEDVTIEYRIDDESWISATYDPDTGYYEDELDVTDVTSGEHTLTARATDSGGNTDRTAISIEVDSDDGDRLSVDSLSLSEVGSRGQHVEFGAKWQVSDRNGGLDSVTLVLIRESDDETVDSVSLDVTGSEASDTTELIADRNPGDSHALELTVTDENGNTTTRTGSVESDAGGSPVINRFSVSEAGRPDSNAEISVLWDVSDPDGLESVNIDVTGSDDTNQGVTWSLGGTEASDIDTFEIEDGEGETFDVQLSVTDATGLSEEKSTSVTA